MVPVAGPVNMTPEQMAKLKSELDMVEQNARVFGEMLTEMKPGQPGGDLELLQVIKHVFYIQVSGEISTVYGHYWFSFSR